MIKLTTAGKDLAVDFKRFNFPVGETHVQLQYDPFYDVLGINVEYEYDGDASIIELLLVADAIRRCGTYISTLTVPYVPFSRQDRVCNTGEPLSLRVFCDLVNTVHAEEVVIMDPHSDVTPALLNNCRVITQADIFTQVILDDYPDEVWLAAPDAGASKKIYQLAERVKPLGVLECGKRRQVTDGKITGVTLPGNISLVKETDTIIIVDDLCDGGASFLYLAKELRRSKLKWSGKIVLMVTHGFFTHADGLDVFLGLIDEIWTRKGRIK